MPSTTGDCENVDIRLVDFFEPQVGQANIWVEAVGDRRIGSDAILLDPDLVGYTTGMVEHVITHEWNHVELAARSGTRARYEDLEREADAYFSPRVVTAEIDLEGVELLTDCMTYYQDGAVAFEHFGFVTTYASQMLGATSMEQACGTGWGHEIPDPLEHPSTP